MARCYHRPPRLQGGPGFETRSRVARASRVDRDDQQRTTGERRPRGMGARRLLGLVAFLPVASRAPVYGRLIWELVRDERTPVGRKILLAAGLGYLVVGRDVVPDDLPVIGGLDDLIVVVLAVDVFLDGVPADVLDEKLEALGIDARAFREDVSRIRRFTPAPLRRLVRQAPGMVTLAGDTLGKSRLGPKVRAWINTEGSNA